jgi:phage shock protein PspC (stress-responsive transcriptional regulator)
VNDEPTRDAGTTGSAGASGDAGTPGGPGTPPPPPGAPGPGMPPPGASGPWMAPPVRPPLRRPREGRILTGVSAGLAVHLGIDVTVVRILIVVLTLVTNGLGLVAYIVAAVLIPADDETSGSTAGSARAGPSVTSGTSAVGARDPLFWVGVGLLVLGALLLLTGPFAADRWFAPRLGPGVVLPLVLIGFGLALWRAGDRRGRPIAPPPTVAAPAGWPPAPSGAAPTTAPFAPARPASTLETPVTTDPRAVGGASSPTTPTPPPGPPEGGGAVPPVWSPPPVGGNRPPEGGGGATAWTPPPAPERPSSLLGRLAFGLALVTVGVLWILEISDVIDLGVGRILAAALLVLGVGLLVGAFVGRARWLILPAALLTPVVLLASVLSPMTWADVDLRTDGVGERVERPASVAEAEAGYQLGAGSLRLDLTGVELDDLEAAGTTRVTVQIGAGEVLVDVPDDVNVTATARAGAGEVALFGTEGSGLGVTRNEALATLGDDAPTIELDVQVGFGTVDVRAVTADRPARDDGTDLDSDDLGDGPLTDEPDTDAAGRRVDRLAAGA